MDLSRKRGFIPRSGRDRQARASMPCVLQLFGRCRIARFESWSGAALRPKRNGGTMKILFAAVLVAGTLAGFGAANAAGGCGPGFHRGPYGGCRPNGGAVVVAPRVVAPRVVVAPAPVVVVPRARVCPYGFAWRYGRCRPI
jgi:hypothetical protein